MTWNIVCTYIYHTDLIFLSFRTLTWWMYVHIRYMKCKYKLLYLFHSLDFTTIHRVTWRYSGCLVCRNYVWYNPNHFFRWPYKWSLYSLIAPHVINISMDVGVKSQIARWWYWVLEHCYIAVLRKRWGKTYIHIYCDIIRNG